jgi:hypothetical protein
VPVDVAEPGPPGIERTLDAAGTDHQHVVGACEGVAEAAGKLQKPGVIRYGRGGIAVLARRGVEARFCECHQVVKPEPDRHLPYVARKPSEGTSITT